MGTSNLETSNTFELALGEDTIDLIAKECHDQEQTDAALTKLTTASNVYQLPTPPATPPPMDREMDQPLEYVSQRWTKRLKIPLQAMMTDHTLPAKVLSPLEKIPCDVLWLILCQTSPVFYGRPVLERQDLISLLLASKIMSIKYFTLYREKTTILEHRELLVLDRITAPVLRRNKRCFSCMGISNFQGTTASDCSDQFQNPVTRDRSASRHQDDDLATQADDVSRLEGNETSDSEEPQRKKRKSDAP